MVGEQVDTSERLLKGFDDLVSVMRSVAENSHSVESRMESGLLSPYEILDSSDDSSDSEGLIFEDA